MTRFLFAFSVLMSALLLCAGVSGNAFAKPSDGKIKNMSFDDQKKNDKTKALAEEIRKKALEKSLKDSKSKKDASKKQIALVAKKTLDYRKPSK